MSQHRDTASASHLCHIGFQSTASLNQVPAGRPCRVETQTVNWAQACILAPPLPEEVNVAKGRWAGRCALCHKYRCLKGERNLATETETISEAQQQGP